MDMLKEFTKNREQEQRLDAPSLEYLEKEIQWDSVKPRRPPQRLALAWSLWKPPNRREYEYLDRFWHFIRLHENFHKWHKFADFERNLGLRLITCLYTPPKNSLSFGNTIGQMGKSIYRCWMSLSNKRSFYLWHLFHFIKKLCIYLACDGGGGHADPTGDIYCIM